MTHNISSVHELITFHHLSSSCSSDSISLSRMVRHDCFLAAVTISEGGDRGFNLSIRVTPILSLYEIHKFMKLYHNQAPTHKHRSRHKVIQ